ncbi:Methylmalonyl-CoA carboxyltransferase 12S subunit [Variovorax sp. SRS16]|uniref:acyl-CoA carboxylase subunit beta n=1 Tax=Variovorax sp. SRS16 TaxID=282217 RepID=UPI0013171606|nr:carboxyl transferase domain-containing protein [Variovorax sp. SRS16]VTU33538.1 Methylmalonyl-CoA carboxyltransferase 12S subunit [Variovorax sp. SRS16]
MNKSSAGTPRPRPDLQAVIDAQAARLDAARPDAVARQRKRGRRTVREVVDLLADPDTFVEYGGLARPAVAAMEGAADGLVMGTAQMGGRPVDLLLYDFTVHAGTQSAINHQKMTRMFEHALKFRLPVLMWLDGGGARPHDMLIPARGKTPTFVVFARLSGWVPTVGVVPGRSFAGQANLAGMCDLLIGLRGAALGMAGPPLVEAALGIRYTPEEIGSMEVHQASGVVDLVVDDEAQAAEVARRYLGYFGPAQAPGGAADQLPMRELVPENPKRSYDVRSVVDTLADIDSVLEIKPLFGACVVTAFIRLNGRAVGVVANQPTQLAGAIDSDGSVKAARFVQICDAFDIPLLLLCDTPGLMVGPDAERTGLVRHSARLLAAIANATVPLMTVVLRKAYGLGYYIMGSQPLDPAILLAWPTAEYGGMGLEGAVNIIHGKELDAIEDPAERAALHARLTQALKDEHTAVAAASHFGYDDVIDPADTRELLLRTLDTLPPAAPRSERKRFIEPF